MRTQRIVVLAGLFSSLLPVTVLRAAQAEASQLPFSCAVFSASTTAADLRARFGAANVKTALVRGGEGDYGEGTVLFDGDPTAKLEIEWRDGARQRDPDRVSVRGKQTRWHSPAGISLGTPLRAIERLNGRPFRLVGFGSDVQGMVMSWSGGKLEAQDTNDCRVRVRLGPDWDNMDAKLHALVSQLEWALEFSSGHPAMQGLNPTANELLLQYHRTPADTRMEPMRH